MKLADFQRIVDGVGRYAIRASLYDTGEPLMNEDIYKMVSDCTQQRISTSISTNLLLFKEEHLEDLFQSQLTILQPDADGITQTTYSIYRVNGDVADLKKTMTIDRTSGLNY